MVKSSVSGSFSTRIEDLIHEGDLVGHVVVDQIYAQIQHENLHFKHPRGGHAKYLESSLYAQMNDYCDKVADSALEDGGRRGMIESMEDLSDQVQVNAPVDINNLRRSGHPFVYDNMAKVYDRAPKQRRLTEEELEELKPFSAYWRMRGFNVPVN